MFHVNVLEEIRKDILGKIKYLFENHAVYEIMWKKL